MKTTKSYPIAVKPGFPEAVDRIVRTFSETFPEGSDLFFPILYCACIWAARRVFDIRERATAWRVWLDPLGIEVKPDAFIRSFFSGHDGLSGVYAGEIAANDIKALRAVFPALYPVCGVEDPFLKGLFKDEIESGDFRTIAAEFTVRAGRAVETIDKRDAAGDFGKILEAFAMEAASLDVHLLDDGQIRDLLLSGIARLRETGLKTR